MKHLKATQNLSFDGGDEHSSPNAAISNSHHNHSSASLNTISIHSHDFELKKRDTVNVDNQSRRIRFFPKRKTKDHHQHAAKPPLHSQFYDDSHSSATATPVRRKSTPQFFGQPLDELVKRHNNQLPPVILVSTRARRHHTPLTAFVSRSLVAIARNSLLQGTRDHGHLS